MTSRSDGNVRALRGSILIDMKSIHAFARRFWEKETAQEECL